MKKIISLLLILLLLASCAKKPDEPDTPVAADPTVEGIAPRRYDFDAQYIRLYRTEQYSGDIADGITVCHSPDDIDAFADGKFDRALDTSEYADGQASFNALTAKYDNDFFKSDQLIICKVTEPSCSTRHEVKMVTDEGVYIDSILSGGGDDAIGEWAIVVETERFDANDIDLYLDNKNVTGTPADVKVGAGKTSLSIHIPEGWEYRENRFVSEEEEYGVYFKPIGRSGELYLNYQTAFGVCGTFLETKKITVAGYECSEMTWDGKADWDIITFPCDYGAVLISNLSAEWLSEYQSELADIFDSIEIEPPSMTAERAKELAAAHYNGQYDGGIMLKYNLHRDTYTVTFAKNGVDHSYTVYPTELVKPENIAAQKRDKG